MENIELKIDNISFSYDINEKKLLENISINIEKGQFIGILGPNGCGKSTLLKLILKYFSLHSGNINIGSKDINLYSQKELSKLISFVPQKSNLSMSLSVLDIIYMGRVPYIKNKWIGFEEEDHKIVKKVMKSLSLDKFSDRMSFSLSGGEFQRVLLARALVQNTKIILLDEPTSALDMNYAMEIMQLTSKISKDNNITVIMVLHDLNLAGLYCDKVVFLKDSKVAYLGSPKELYKEEIFEEIYGFKCSIVENNGYPYILPTKI